MAGCEFTVILYTIVYTLVQSAVPFWPENDTKRLKIKVEGCVLPPRTIDFTRHENCLLLHMDNSVSNHPSSIRGNELLNVFFEDGMV